MCSEIYHGDHFTRSLCFTPEPSVKLYVKYISIKKKGISRLLSSLGCRGESVSLPFPISRGYLQTSLVMLSGKESACQCRRHGFDTWVGKIPWRRKRQPSPLFLPGKFHGQRSLAGYNP